MKLLYYWLFLVLMVMLILGMGAALADRDEYEKEDEDDEYFLGWFRSDSMQVDTLGVKRYQEECGSCHFPFQPGFLPKASWALLMSGLDDHFGENAELTDEDHESILNYLIMNAADTSDREISRKVLWSIRAAPVPLRITETGFFQHEHDEIPQRVLRNNGENISFSNCDTCHTRALQGFYEEDEIDIPGYGRWDD
jgi:mono/diheme cytochrome c family protein